jgi:quinoprotein glucose dehydrogenase
MSSAEVEAEGEEYRIIKGAAFETSEGVGATPAPANDPAVSTGWSSPGGDDWARRHSPLQQLTSENVSSLRLLHVVDAERAFGGAWEANSEAPPLNWGPFVFWMSADHRLVAVDSISGTIRWQVRLPVFRYVSRGFVLRERADKTGATLFVPFGPFIAALDAQTGRLAPVLGGDGLVSVPGATTVSPVIWNGVLLVASYEPQALLGIDIESGAVEWSVPLHPANRTFEGGAPWSGMAIDRGRSLLFLTTGNPRPPLFGASRAGDNQNSSSVIAIDLARKAIKWAFQEVRHDLWDFDIPAGPLLTSVVVNQRSFDVVIAVTKIGNTLVLNRETGRPVFDFRLRRAPPSRYRREQVATHQPDLQTPEPLMDIAFDPSMVTNVSERSRDFVSKQIEKGLAIYGRFVPPELNKDLISFGLHGGAEWHGASVNQKDGLLYVPVNMIPWALRMYIHSAPDYDHSDLPGRPTASTYTAKCASCHLPNRNGDYVNVGEAATHFVPSLHGYTLLGENRSLFTEASFRHRHPALHVTQQELDDIWSLFEAWDQDLFKNGNPSLWYHWRQLLDQDGLPGSAPPWGKLVALNLSTGRKVWETPLGEKHVNGRVVETGSPSYGGLLTTAGGLVFVVGTDDNYIRAIDAASGVTRWRYKLAAAGSAPPITFEYRGKQYQCVIATGGRFHNFVDKANKLYIFAL